MNVSAPIENRPSGFWSRHRRKLFVVQAILFLLAGMVIAGAFSRAPVRDSPDSTQAGVSTPVGETLWTCSMHPQIRQPRPGKCPICGMDLIPVARTSGGMRTLAISEGSRGLMSIETSPVERKYVTHEIPMAGRVDYDETKLDYITAWVPGRLDRMFVDFTGIEVKKGDHLPRSPVPTDAIPDVGENQQIIFTEWMGRSPQDVEDQISYPLTVSLLGVPSVKTVRSYSMFGFSTIYVIFDEDVEFYWSRTRVLEKLNSLPAGTLPEGVTPTLGPDATPLGQVYWYTLEGRDPDGQPVGGWGLDELHTVQDWHVRYYRCSNNSPAPDHPTVRWKSGDLEQAIVDDLAKMRLATPEIASWFRPSLNAAVTDLTSYQRRQASSLGKRKSELVTMQDRLLNAYLTGTVDEDAYKAKIHELRAEAANVDATLARLGDIDPARGDNAVKLFDWTQNAAELWRGSNSTVRRQILDSVCLNRTVGDVTLCLAKKKPFDVFVERLVLEKSRGDKTAIELFRTNSLADPKALSVMCQALTSRAE